MSNSGEDKVPVYTIWFDTAAQTVEGVRVTLSSSSAPSRSPSPGTSPSNQRCVKMSTQREKAPTELKLRTTAKSKLTSRKDILTCLEAEAAASTVVANMKSCQEAWESRGGTRTVCCC